VLDGILRRHSVLTAAVAQDNLLTPPRGFASPCTPGFG
jgi:hypothetical protein